MNLVEIKCEDPTGSGMVCEHNMPCAVCSVNHAVICCNNGVFEPCWSCQAEGWTTIRTPKKWGFWKKFWGWIWFARYEFKLVNVEEYQPKTSEWV